MSEYSEYTQGYADAVGWLPSAKLEELEQIVGDVFVTPHEVEIYQGHSLAKYLAWEADGPDGFIGFFGPADIPYNQGFAAALREHRPDVFRAERKAKLLRQREMLIDQMNRELAALDAQLSELDSGE